MYRKFLTARSPMRLLEKGLHGGLGAGNLGVVLAGHGLGKTAFLVGVALDELLRGKRVLHVAFDHDVAHVREHYDTVFDELAATAQLEDLATLRAELERRRSIRVYLGEAFRASRLREALKLEEEAGGPPALVLLDDYDVAAGGRGELEALRALAAEIDAEMWLAVACAEERVGALPPPFVELSDLFSVILALEPAADAVRLRALKDHDNPDVSALHVSLDPRTLLLVRS